MTPSVDAPRGEGAVDEAPPRAHASRDGRLARAIGRTARLELVFEKRGGRTVLARSYAEPPFRVGRVFDLDGAAYAILVCAGPGIFGGDALSQSIHVASGARVLLTTQAALQAHPSLERDASILHQRFIVDDDAELHCQFDPVIPFAGSRFEQIVDIRLAGTSRFCWCDALMAGRVECGERWRFDRLAHELSLSIAGTRAYLERYALAPADGPIDRGWTTRGAAYFSTALLRDSRAAAETVEALHRRLAAIDGVAAAADLVEPSLAVARLTAARGGPFARARTSYREWALATIFQRPELAARK